MAGAPLPQLHLVVSPPGIDPGSDAELVARAKGDAQAFAELYRRYVDIIYRYCYRRLGDRTATEDATSEIFTKAFTGIARFRETSSFRSWLFSIAHNTVSDSFRSFRADEPIDSASSVLDPAPGPEERALLTDGERSVRGLLAALTTQQAAILELRLAGLTGPEIAEVLGCSLASVKIGQFRGYRRLREILGRPDRREEGARDR